MKARYHRTVRNAPAFTSPTGWFVAISSIGRSGESFARACRDLRVFHLRRPQSIKPRMPEVLVRCPFQEFELPHQDRLEPPAVFHLRGGQPLAPSSSPRLRQIRERTHRRLKPPEPLV
jgi:hypothetical protein